jgi:metal-responsive CopG/Arc/MetJ family transcriptional regulator
MKTMTVAMPDQMYVDLHRLARQRGVTRGALIRQLIAQHLNEQTGNVYPTMQWGGYRVPRRPRRTRRVRQQQS